jgi:multidrug efflux pump subunit AcrA (membrane-fusion protein)
MFKKFVPILLVIVTLLYVTKGFWQHKEIEKTVDVGTGFQQPVTVTSVRSGALSEKMKLPVDIKALTEVKVIPTFLGRIEQYYVKEGDQVAAGDKLLKYVGPSEGEEGFFDDLIVKAPISGSVTAILKDAGMNAIKDEPLLTITSIETVRAIVNLPSEYNGMLTVGMQADIDVDAFSEKTFKGTLRSVRPQVDAVSRTSYVEFIIANKDHLLLPGMGGTISFKSGTATSGLIVPLSSVFMQNGQAYVFITAGGKALRKKVQILQEGVDEAVVRGDIQSGSAVITTRSDSLKDGDTVYVVK